MSTHITAGQLIHQLQTLDPDLPAYLAINPDWPYAHRIGRVAVGHGLNGPAIYIAEDGQEDILPPDVRTELGWAAV
ncbi:hypothetical protein [Streptomyces tubercidicus]|uniref:hypothetical protein n=1 Tax=Streptomyces tubercidicus TaxID=47759 RepID=UPI002E10460A|nr:hypothetical protein OG761_29580 [Streptomyces tubercidicus]WSX19726.1 hypothetical protein OG690_07810 [Streptomyces tubercidicus]